MYGIKVQTQSLQAYDSAGYSSPVCQLWWNVFPIFPREDVHQPAREGNNGKARLLLSAVMAREKAPTFLPNLMCVRGAGD